MQGVWLKANAMVQVSQVRLSRQQALRFELVSRRLSRRCSQGQHLKGGDKSRVGQGENLSNDTVSVGICVDDPSELSHTGTRRPGLHTPQ